MKAVILEVKNGDAAALKDDGTVVKIKDENYKVGDVIRMKEKKPLFNKKWGTLVAALLIFAMVGTSTYVNAAPNLDVWVEDGLDDYRIEVSKTGKVLNVYKVEGDEEELLDDPDLENISLKEVVIELVGIEDLDFSDLPRGLLIVVASENDMNAEKFAQKLLGIEKVEVDDDDDEVGEKPEKDDIPGNIEAISNQMVIDAKMEGIAPGKMNIVNKLLLADDGKVVDLEKDYALTVDRGQSLEEALIVLAKEKPEELMKIYTETRGKETAPGQLKKQEEAQTQNRSIEQETEENQEMNNNKPESNPGNKGGNGKGNGNN